MKEEIPRKCFEKREVMVFLGHEDTDVDWIVDQLSTVTKQKGTQLFTVYNPKTTNEIYDSEKKQK